MERVVLATDAAPEIVIKSVGRDLRVSGWERNEFYAETDESRDLQAEKRNGGLVCECQADCTIRVPRQARLKVENVGGSARFKSLEAALEIGVVGGDLVLRRTAGTEVARVGGDVSARKVDGPLTLHVVGGDASVRGVAGEFQAETVGGDLYLRDVQTGARAKAGANAVINLDFAPGQEYSFTVGGDLLCRLAPGVSAQIDIQAGGDLAVDVPGARLEGNGSRRRVILGEGGGQAALQAGGDVTLAQASADPEAMGEFGEHFGEEFGVMAEEFATQIESQMAEFEKHLEERMGSLDQLMGASHVNAEAIAARARQAADRARNAAQRRAEAAQRRAEAAQRRSERHAENARRRAEREAERGRRAGAWSFKFSTPPSPPTEPVSDDERLAILRMVEQGKISVEQAEKLLAALEGRE